MGDFQVSCAFTGSISGGEEVALVLMIPSNPWGHGDRGEVSIYPTSTIISNEGAAALYWPVGVVYGEFGDSNLIRKVRDSGTAKALADYFGMSVAEFANNVSCGYKGLDCNHSGQLDTLSGMWVRAKMWERLTTGHLDSSELGSTEALHSYEFGCPIEALFLVGFQECGYLGRPERYNRILQLSGFEEDLEGRSITVASDSRWIRVRLDEQYINEFVGRMSDLAKVLERLTGRCPDFSHLDRSYVEFHMEWLKKDLESRYWRWYEVPSTASWSPLKEVYASPESGPLWEDPQIGDDLCRLAYLNHNMWATSKLFMPTPKGPTYGDHRATMALAKHTLEIVQAANLAEQEEKLDER